MTPNSVLEAITPSRVGGAEVYVSSVCQRLPSLGFHADLFCPEGRPFIAYAAQRGIPCVSWKTYGKLDPYTIVRLALLIRRRHIGVIHTHLSTASILGALAGKLARRPSVAHVHGLNTATTYKYSDTVIAVSGAVKDHLLAQGLEEKRIRVLHNAVDPSEFQPVPVEQAKASAGFGVNTAVLGVFGRLSSEKGQKDALQAMRIIGKAYPGARLVVAGAGKDQQELAAETIRSGLAGTVTFIGFLSDVRPLMSACDVVIVPSLREGFGLAAVEAMALGRPVVASAVGGLREIVVDGETGILVPPGKPGVLAEAVTRLLGDRILAELLGRQGRQRVLESFNLDRHMKELVDILVSPDP